MMSNSETYYQRFSRNIGILTYAEQKKLSNTSIGIAGLGGIGGQTFINLVRMGVGKFIIADLDTFEIANTNRQIGAMESTFGRTKISIMSAIAKNINPEVEIVEISNGIQNDTVDDFVISADIIVDSLDFFCLTPRRYLYDSCLKNKKTVILSAPLGFSATLHAFTPDSMSAKDYFNWSEGMDKFDQMIHFAVGMAPSGLHLKYLDFDKDRLAETGTGPSISFSCGLGAAILAGEVLFAILGRRQIYKAPYYTQFDLYTGTYVRKKLFLGNRGILQRLKIFVAKRHYASVKNKLLEHIK